MAARPLSSTTIAFGLVSIPVKLFTATSAQGVHFNQLHKKCGSRLKQRMYCPIDNEYVERDDIVKGFEVGKDQYVTFSGEELHGLETERFQTLDLVEFVPESTVDFVYIEKSYYIGPDKGGGKAFNLLTKAMRKMERIGVGRYWTRGKEQLVLLRPYKKGLILHQVFYANEVRSYDDVELGPDQAFSEAEETLAAQLIASLSVEAFDPHKYKDEYATRVLKAAEQKTAGQEVTLAPEQPAAQIIDLFEALKQSLNAAQSREAAGDDQLPMAVAAGGGAPAPAPERSSASGGGRRSSAGRSPKKA